MRNFINSLQRITSSGRFIPQIDGLRFVAIASVILHHTFRFFYLYNKKNGVGIPQDSFLFILDEGFLGVQVFFAISGFVLALPFASHYLLNDRKPKLKDYFIRRLTRLEPPYLLCIFLILLFKIIYTNDVVANLLKSFFASVFYIKNVTFPEIPFLNSLTWSLEIEVQFYILAPLLAMVFKLPTISRRFVLIAFSLILILAQKFWMPPYKTLYSYLQYFLIGFFIADLYLSGFKIKLPAIIAVLLGLISFCTIWSSDYLKLNYHVWLVVLYFAIMIFFFLVLFTDFWKKVFAVKIITVIGGMCYSFYLWHGFILYWFGKKSLDHIFSGNYLKDFILFALVCLPVIIVFSTLYFKFVEQPCMQRDWHKKLWNKLRKKGANA